MAKKLWNERKRIVIYIGKVDYYHIERAAGGKGKIGQWIRKLIEEKLFK